MTAAQKTAKAKFKQAIAYRQKTGVSLKEAFAHIYGKKVSGSSDYYTRKKEGRVKARKTIKKAAPKKKVAKKVVRKVVKKKAAPKKVAKKKLTPRDYDKRYQAKKPGKRISTGKNYPYIEGNVYYENRANRSDRGKLLGIGKSGFSLMTDLNETLQKMHDTQNRINIYTNASKDKSTSIYDKINIRQELKNQKKYLTELKTHFRELKKML